jgi:hypothetical protein
VLTDGATGYTGAPEERGEERGGIPEAARAPAASEVGADCRLTEAPKARSRGVPC